jgi:hypothetical protein
MRRRVAVVLAAWAGCINTRPAGRTVKPCGNPCAVRLDSNAAMSVVALWVWDACERAPQGCGASFLLRSPWVVLTLFPLFLLFLFFHLLLLAFFLVFLATFVSHVRSFPPL